MRYMQKDLDRKSSCRVQRPMARARVVRAARFANGSLGRRIVRWQLQAQPCREGSVPALRAQEGGELVA
jgi:hypothetical protein